MADQEDDFDSNLEDGTMNQDFETPMGSSLRQSRFRVPNTANPTTARLRRVSTSILRAAPGGEDQFGEATPQGGGQGPPRQARPAANQHTRTAGSAGFGQQQGPRARYAPTPGVIPPPPPRDNSANTTNEARTPTTNNTTKQHSKFVLDEDVPDEDMLDVEVALKKEDYGAVGSSDYRKNRAMATAPLSEKFGVARHKVLASAEEGDQSKYAHVQSVIVGILHRVRQGEARAKAMDWMDICTIPFLVESNLANVDCSTWWDSSEINIWQDWDVLTLNQVRRWQYSVNKRFSTGDRIASNWLMTFVSDSSTDSLRTAVLKKYEKLESTQKGGVIYLYLTLCEMFQMSREVEEAMFKFLDIFKRTGVSRFTGENVLVVQEEVTGVCKRLDSIGALRSEHVMDVLQGLGICSNTKFRDMFKHLKQTAELNNLTVLLPSVPPDAGPMEQIEAVLEKAVDHYDLLCTAGLWNKTSRGGSALQSIVDAVNICWNCGEKGHTARQCKKPKDPETFNKNRKAWLNNKNSGSNNNGQGGKKEVTPEYQRKRWENNSCTMVNGVLYINCKKCGFNTSHSSKFHNDFAKNPSSYKMAGTHFYVKECAAIGQSYGGVMKTITSPAGVHTPPPPPPPTQPPPTVNSGSMVSIDRNKPEGALAEYERKSTNPNASELTDMFRSLFLN